MKQEISSSALNNVFHKAVQKAIRENRALGLSNLTVKDGELVEEKPDGTISTFGQETSFWNGESKEEKIYFEIGMKRFRMFAGPNGSQWIEPIFLTIHFPIVGFYYLKKMETK